MLQYWVWLATRTGMSEREKIQVLSYFDSPEDCYYADASDCDRMENLRQSMKEAILDKDLTEAEIILKQCKSLGKIDESLYRIIRPDEDFILGDLTIKPFSNTHDAAQPLGYRVEQGHRSVAVCTDLGNYSQYTVSKLQGLDAILLESNHDIRMLQVGPYPYALKQRVMGDYGHLSNEACGRLLCEILHDDMKHITLGHLSKENNLPELAYESVRLEITMGDNPYDAGDFPITVAKRDVPSQLIYID